MTPVKGYNGYSIEYLQKQLLEETNSENIKEITNILNAHLKKKDLIRKNQLSNLQDKIYNQIEQRITNKSDYFSNKDLLDYFKVVEDTLEHIDVSEESTAVPQIHVTNQQLNINLDQPTMSRTEKLQVVDAVKSIISKLQAEQSASASGTNTIIDGEFKQINEQ